MELFAGVPSGREAKDFFGRPFRARKGDPHASKPDDCSATGDTAGTLRFRQQSAAFHDDVAVSSSWILVVELVECAGYAQDDGDTAGFKFESG